jgi:hypothetical protein
MGHCARLGWTDVDALDRFDGFAILALTGRDPASLGGQ